MTMVSLETYLEETIEAIDPSFTMTVNEQHRKSMIRALLGLSKIDFKQQLRHVKTQFEWNQSEAFVKEHLLQMSSPRPTTEQAPQFEETLAQYETFQTSPRKLFSVLARGRTYQGNFERLLQDIQPALVPLYEAIFAERTDTDWLEKYIEMTFLVEDAGANDSLLRKELMQCVHMALPQASPQPLGGGKSSGIQGELDLLAYLERQTTTTTTTTTSSVGRTRTILVLSPVWLKSKNGKKPSKKCPFVVEIPASVNLKGMTNELDAIVVQVNEDDKTVELVQVWEAKATLNPITLHDALSKKYEAISTILVKQHEEEEESSSELLMDGKRYSILSNKLPQLGIFGNSILSPLVAARRVQLTLCERLLETNTQVVREALQTGQVTVPMDLVLSKLQKLQELALQLQPTVVVNSEASAD